MPPPPIEFPPPAAVKERIRYHRRETRRLEKLLRLIGAFGPRPGDRSEARSRSVARAAG